MKSAGIALVVLCCLQGVLFSQVGQKGLNADGKDFYLGWLYPSYNFQNLNLGTRDPKPFFGVYALVSSYTDNEFSVSYFDDGTGKEIKFQTYHVGKRRATIVPIDRPHMTMDAGGPNGFDGEVAQYRAMHITAKKPINVQFFSSGANSGGGYLALPVNVLGKEYVVEAYKDNASGAGGYLSSEDASGYFMVIAAFDGTTVQIVPNSTTKVQKQPGVNCGPGANGTPQGFIIALQRGQCYMVKSTGNDSYCDISGSTVVADKPVVVIGGHENAFTDGSDVGTILVEQRDYMVEQMIPVEYWDSTGYISVPMVDSKSAPGGEGDNIAFFYGKLQNAPPNYPKGSTVHTLPDIANCSIGPYPSAVPIRSGINKAMSASDDNGVKMHMVQYDQRMQGGAPYPAPSQMSIVPMSCWKTSYLWDVPANVTPQEVYQGYYITLICDARDYNEGTLQWAQDGGALVPIKSAGTVNGTRPIPGYPNLVGMAVKLNAPRSYYATSKKQMPFMVYNYGFRAIDADRDLGDFCADDHFFGNANPAGFAESGTDSSFFTVTVDTLCSMWDICATVTGTNAPKIKSIILLSDPEKDFVSSGATAYDSYNVVFDKKLDPIQIGEVNYLVPAATQCLRATVLNPFDIAYASVLIEDDHRNYVIVPLKYDHGKMNIRSSTAYLQQPNDLVFPSKVIGDKQTVDIIYKNYGDPLKGDSTYLIKDVSLTQGNQGFKLVSVSKKLPGLLAPGDSLVVQLSFESSDTTIQADTMLLFTDCFGAPVYLSGHNSTGLIAAGDFYFGDGVVHQANYKGMITIQNLGTQPFTLQKDFILHDTVNFSVESASKARFPYTLYPIGDSLHYRKDTIQLWVVFHPQNKFGSMATTIDWKTDLRAPFETQIKSYTDLSGVGTKLGIHWDRVFVKDETFKDRPVVNLVNLISQASTPASIDKVFFTGPDASEYSISANKLNKPLQNFLMYSNDTIWMEYTFTPNLTKPENKKYVDRHADLVVTYFVDGARSIRDSEVIHFTGVVDSLTSEVSYSTVSSDMRLHPYCNNDKVIISVSGLDNIKEISLYDLLGNKVIQWDSKAVERTSSGIVLPKPAVASGLYILKIEADRMTASGKLIILKE